jgi:hypothetical protein
MYGIRGKVNDFLAGQGFQPRMSTEGDIEKRRGAGLDAKSKKWKERLAAKSARDAKNKPEAAMGKGGGIVQGTKKPACGHAGRCNA